MKISRCPQPVRRRNLLCYLARHVLCSCYAKRSAWQPLIITRDLWHTEPLAFILGMGKTPFSQLVNLLLNMAYASMAEKLRGAINHQ